MHLPYIAHVMKGREFTIVPIMVGATSKDAESTYGSILADYIADPANFFVVSSDFCHWGKRFDFTHYDKACGDIWQSIEALDKRGIQAIEGGDPHAFASYISETKNTVCGRHPIAVMMWAYHHYAQGVGKGQPRLSFRAVYYTQSSKCSSGRDSSVSYASLVLAQEDKARGLQPLPPMTKSVEEQ
eukprot:TRINITY_DN8223_c0_g1_i3.p1 TRINITY_DN8223_c0_g1~~TRINITY_DN8223_c0_g1_i3.p1  ORF type:complete len:185 (-),score=28.76 TRINITY_DN8223_c0_g1_i3:60-614(-)